MKILVVDDDSMVLKSCERILKEEGYSVVLASSVKTALEILANDNFHLILVDVIMPEYDGMYLVEQIQKTWPKIPIVVMSGYPTQDTIDEGINRGAVSFIPKPFTPDELLKTLQKAGRP